MSALTDLFTALANKIRSNLGGSDTYTPAEMVDAIDDVYDAGESAGIASAKVGTAVAGDVLSGKTFTNSSSIGASGSMTNNGAVSPSALSAGSSYTVPAGYHNGSGVVTTQTLAAQTGVDTGKTAIDSSHVLTGYQGWVNGNKISGSYTPSSSNIQASKSATAGTTAIDVTPDSGYDAMAKVVVSPTPSETKTDGPNVSTTKDVTPTSGKLLSKVTINPLTHTGYSPSSSSYTSITMGTSQTIDLGANHDKRYVRVQATGPSGTKDNTGTPLTTNGDHTITGLSNYTGVKVNVNVPGATYDGDAAVGNVLYGKTFYSDSSTKKTGTMTNNGAVSPSALSAGGSYTIPAGYHNGSGVVSAKDLASQTGVDSGKTAVTAAKMFSGYQGWVNGSKVSGTYTEPTISDITPSDSSPVRIYDGNIYRPNDDGYAIYSYTDVMPSDASPAHFHDEFVKFPSTGGYVIKSQPATLTPSDSSPVVISNGTIYKANGSGYAIESSPTTLTPSDSNPPAIASGVIYKGGGAGFAVATKPSKTETTLWTNTATSSSFDAQDVTLSQSIDNFDYIKIKFAMSTTYKTDAYCVECIYSKEDIRKTSTDTNGIQMGMCAKTSSSRYNARRVTYVSDTKLNFSSALQMSGSTAVNTAVLPLSIVGVKFSGITL